jgi:hypothetical protein
MNVRQQETVAHFFARMQRLERQGRRHERQLALVFMLLIRSGAIAWDELIAALTALVEALADEDRREAAFYEEVIRHLRELFQSG